MRKKILALSVFAVVCSLISILPAQTSFSEKANDKGINHFYTTNQYMGGGAAWFDYDNDGDEDVWITGGANQDQLFQNQGDGSFLPKGTQAGLSVTNGIVTDGVITGDIDNDGDRDVFVSTNKRFHNLLFLNNGDGTFTDISVSAGISDKSAWSMAASFGDVNLDGYLDLYVGNFIEEDRFIRDDFNKPIGFSHTCYENFFYLNNGDLTFTELGQSLALADTGCALAVTFTDFDQDHDADILLANDFGEWIVPNGLFRNNQSGNSFTNVSIPAQMDAEIYGMGIAVGDYDQDQDLDYYITNLGRNILFENDGLGVFTDKSAEAGVEDTYESTTFTVGWGCSFEDADNDTDLDLFVVNGHIPAFDFIATNTHSPDRLFLNEGDGTFLDYSAQAGVNFPARGRGSATADYDQDGDIDWIIVPVNKIGSGDPIEKVLFHRNDLSNTKHWLRVKLEGTVNNRDAFGSLIKIVLPDRSWVHEISGGSSHGSQNSSIAHFGLGAHQQVDSLIITWPGGKEQSITDIPADQLISIIEDSSLYATSLFKPQERLFIKSYPNPFSERIRIEYLLPKTADVDISIYNIQGQRVRNLVHTRQISGTQYVDWDGRDHQGNKIIPGMYVALVRIGNKSQALQIHYGAL